MNPSHPGIKIITVATEVLPERNHLGFVNFSPTVVNDTRRERSSRVLQHRKTKILIFFSIRSEFNFVLYFNLF